jgi:hypothetical protein
MNSIKLGMTVPQPLILPWDETFDIGSDTATPVDDKDDPLRTSAVLSH